MDELKPCPFCGGKAIEFARNGRRYNNWIVFVKCEVCEAQTRVKRACGDPDDDPEFWEQGPVQAVKDAWNRRTDDG